MTFMSSQQWSSRWGFRPFNSVFFDAASSQQGLIVSVPISKLGGICCFPSRSITDSWLITLFRMLLYGMNQKWVKELTPISQELKSIHVTIVANLSQLLLRAKDEKQLMVAIWNVVQYLKIHLSFQLNTSISWCDREEKISAMKALLKKIYVFLTVQSKRNLQGTHLKSWWEEGRTDPMHISSVDLDANVAVVHLEEVECALFGADVALAWEWGHSDCVSLLEQGHVVAQSSIHIALRGKRDALSCHRIFLKVLLE